MLTCVAVVSEELTRVDMMWKADTGLCRVLTRVVDIGVVCSCGECGVGLFVVAWVVYGAGGGG